MLNHLLDVAPSPVFPGITDAIDGLSAGSITTMLVVGVVLLVCVVAVFAFILGKNSKK